IGTKRVDGGVINNWGNTFANGVVLREARITASDFMMSGLSLGAGISPWTFDVRGQGHSFAFDPRHSQSIRQDLKTVQDGPGTLAAHAGDPNELQPVGFWLNYSGQNSPFSLDVVMLPAVIEGGPPSNDEALYAVDFWYKLDSVGKGSKVGGIIAL